MESFRLGTPSKVIVTNHPPALPRPALPHVPKCHIHVDFEPLQGWGLQQFPRQFQSFSLLLLDTSKAELRMVLGNLAIASPWAWKGRGSALRMGNLGADWVETDPVPFFTWMCFCPKWNAGVKLRAKAESLSLNLAVKSQARHYSTCWRVQWFLIVDYAANQYQSTFYDLDLIFNIMLIIIAFATNCVKS